MGLGPRYGRYDEAGITSSIWFSNAVGGDAARRSPYRDHPGGGLGAPIGVVPLNGPGRAPRLEDIGGIVAADLRNSGKFNPLDRSRLPQQPATAQEVQPAAWSALGIDAVVVGQVTPNPDGSYNVAYQLVDTGGAPGTVLAQNSYKVNKQWLRYAGHTASDESL
ncbi:translocation protein TolB [Salmonella bongori]|nr:translocation protein TolB [Salmonella bongori]